MRPESSDPLRTDERRNPRCHMHQLCVRSSVIRIGGRMRIAKLFATFELWCVGADYMRPRLGTAWLHDFRLGGRHRVQVQ